MPASAIEWRSQSSHRGSNARRLATAQAAHRQITTRAMIATAIAPAE